MQNPKKRSQSAGTVPMAFVGRQPILDRNLNVYGYELLFRDGNLNIADISDGDSATSQVISNTFLELGLESIVGPHWAFINVTRAFLMDSCPLSLPMDRVVLEVLEDTVIDEALVTSLTSLRDQGYAFALDDFVYSPSWDPLIDLSALIKLDVKELGEQTAGEQADLMHSRGKMVLAEKVETRAEFETYKQLGFDYFQGYFFARPEIVSGRRLPANKLANMRLLASLNDPAADMGDLENIIKCDMSLSYRLLRYINSATFPIRRKVESIRQAIILLGLNPLRRWASLMVMAANNDKPMALMQAFLVRARICELLAEANGEAEVREMFFTAGLFSGLDALMDHPLEEIVHALPISAELSDAITEHKGPAGNAVACAIAFERCRPEATTYAALSPAVVQACCTAATAWSYQFSSDLRD